MKTTGAVVAAGLALFPRKGGKTMERKIILLVAFVSVCVPGMVTHAQAGHQHECSVASLRGAYAFYTTATVVPAGTPRVNVAVLTFDGEGNYTTSHTINDNGTITRGTLSGLTYEVNADCTGRTFDPAGNEQGDLVLLDGGHEFYFIRTNPASMVLLGFGKRQFHEKD